MVIDDKTIQGCVAGKALAQRELYVVCYPVMMPVCMRYSNSREDAAELLNIGFYKILSIIGKFDLGNNFIAWSKRVLINSILDELRKNKRYNEKVQLVDNSELNWRVESVHGWFDNKLISVEDIYKYVQELPPLTASIFNLKAIDGYQHAEISQMLNISLSASKWHYVSAKSQLQKKILEKMKSVKSIEV